MHLGLRIALLVCLTCVGCASLSYTVDNDVFAEMSADKKLRLFDAENDVSLAADTAEQMRIRARDLGLEARAADAQADDAADSQVWGQGAVAMWQRRVEYLLVSRDYLRERADVQDEIIVAAEAKFELAKALLVKKNRLGGADKLDVHKFETQVDWAQRRANAAREKLVRNKPRLERIRAAWLKARESVMGSTLPVVGVPGDDETPVWEAW